MTLLVSLIKTITPSEVVITVWPSSATRTTFPVQYDPLRRVFGVSRQNQWVLSIDFAGLACNPPPGFRRLEYLIRNRHLPVQLGGLERLCSLRQCNRALEMAVVVLQTPRFVSASCLCGTLHYLTCVGRRKMRMIPALHSRITMACRTFLTHNYFIENNSSMVNIQARCPHQSCIPFKNTHTHCYRYHCFYIILLIEYPSQN